MANLFNIIAVPCLLMNGVFKQVLRILRPCNPVVFKMINQGIKAV